MGIAKYRVKEAVLDHDSTGGGKVMAIDDGSLHLRQNQTVTEDTACTPIA